jgi:uracil phosphoribosyltransferase
MSQARIVEHPLIEHDLLVLRDRDTDAARFRAALERLTAHLVAAATADLPAEPHTVHSPMAPCEGRRIAARVGLLPILRAGLGMVDPALGMLPHAEVWHLGFYRDERSLEPVGYYNRLPDAQPVDLALILDPMLATGGSAAAAIDATRQWGVQRIKLLAVIAAPEGIEKINTAHPDASICVCAVDSHLDDRGFIIPGLGDAGDRMFNAVAE